MAAFVSDSFAYTADTNLSAHGWVAHRGSIFVDNTGTKATPVFTSASEYYLPAVTPPNADYAVRADITFGGAEAAGSIMALTARNSSDELTYYYAGVLWNSSAGRFFLRRARAGTYTTLATVGGPYYTTAETQAAELRVVTNGAQVDIEFWWGGALVLSYSDTSANRITDAGYPGIGKNSATRYGSYWDNFEAEVIGGAADVEVTGAQQVGDYAQMASLATDDVAGLSAAQSVGGYGQIASIEAVPGEATIGGGGELPQVQDLHAGQQVGSFTQSAAGAADVSASASQAAGAYSQAAAIAADAGLAAAQPVGGYTQSAAMSATDAVGLAAAQGVGEFAQVAAVQVDASAVAAQALEGFSQSARVDVPARLQSVQPVGGYAQTALLATEDAITLSASQQVGLYGQAAAVSVLLAAQAAQSVGEYSQTAWLSAEGAAVLAAAQQVGVFGQVAGLAADAGLVGGQSVSEYGQVARLGTGEEVILVADQGVGSYAQTGWFQVPAMRPAGALTAGLPVPGMRRPPNVQSLRRPGSC